ncbi:MAG TPA: hypothetical protein VFJ16_09615 [Longimicrobium sp.]|nr:hypothetical protein [Longimicrobium sp.]
MPKLKLDLEQLAIESFATRAAPQALRGTVLGNKTVTFECQWTGIQYPTCDLCPNPTIEEPGCA